MKQNECFGCFGATWDVKLNFLSEKSRKLCNKIAKISAKFFNELKMKEWIFKNQNKNWRNRFQSKKINELTNNKRKTDNKTKKENCYNITPTLTASNYEANKETNLNKNMNIKEETKIPQENKIAKGKSQQYRQTAITLTNNYLA